MPISLCVNQLETVFEILLGIISFFCTWTIGDTAYWKNADKWYINILLLVKYAVGINEIIDGVWGLYSVTYIREGSPDYYNIVSLYYPWSWVVLIIFRIW